MPRSIAKSRLEALLSMATGAAAEVPAGLAGLYGAATGGSGEGVRLIDKVRDKLTYQPRDPRGQQEIARALGPIMQKIEAGKSYLGDGAFNKTGSPALAAAAYTAPDALLSLLGARPALAAGRSASQGIGRAVARSAALPAPSIGSPASQIGAIRAYHGSPHDFDRFSMDHIGTGEGAQVYGKGLYFAGKPEVAHAYRKKLSGPREDFDGTIAPDVLEAFKAEDYLGFESAGEAISALRTHPDWNDRWDVQDPQKLREAFESHEARKYDGRGKFYEVELAPDEDDLLDFDVPLAQQPPKVQEALTKAGIPGLMDEWAHRGMDTTGGELLQKYLHILARQKGVEGPGAGEKYLKSAGVPGLRYLDAGSRDAGNGTRNYVMFDDSLIKILGKK